MLRFLAIIWDASDGQRSVFANRLLRDIRVKRRDFSPILSRSGVDVLCAGNGTSDVHELQREAGVILGTVFYRLADTSPMSDGDGFASPERAVFDEKATAKVVASEGRTLISSFWGSYVGIVVSESGKKVFIVRDPTGNLPCYVVRHRGMTVAFSYLPDVLALGFVEFNVNWRYLATYVAGGQNHSEQTALNEVSRLNGGECIEINPVESRRHLYWHPQEFVNDQILEDADRATQMLHAVVGSCTSAWASRHPRLVHQTSGGLDSSIVLHGLARSSTRPNITCLTYYVPDGNSDERPLARLAARSAKAHHIEQPRDYRVDLRDLFKLSQSSAPEVDFAALETGRLDQRIALDVSATAIFDGTGGDYLFYRGSHEFAAADYLWRHGLRPELFSIAIDVALLTDRTVWQVLMDAIRDGFQWRDWGLNKEVLSYRKLVTDEVIAEAARQNPRRHPLLADSDEMPRGVLLPLLCITLPPPYYDPLWQPGDPSIERVSPLLSQPVAELCLRIPSYVHMNGARDRGIARRAFESFVPDAILNRQWKDRAAGFIDGTVAWNLPFIREVLEDGILVKHGLLNRQRLSRTLSGTVTKDVPYPMEVMDHLATEVWLQRWSLEQRRAVA
jgi:asparagine synthase (glutamine-hydrolysing)